jgi:prevent-host-death family protein
MQAREAIRAWIIDDTGIPKKGKHSVGVSTLFGCRLARMSYSIVQYVQIMSSAKFKSASGKASVSAGSRVRGAAKKVHKVSGARLVGGASKIFTPFALTPDNVLPSVAATALRQSGSEVLSHVAFKGEEVIITRNGKATAVIMPIATYEIFVDLEDASDLAVAQRVESELRASGEKTIPIAEARKRLRL